MSLRRSALTPQILKRIQMGNPASEIGPKCPIFSARLLLHSLIVDKYHVTLLTLLYSEKHQDIIKTFTNV